MRQILAILNSAPEFIMVFYNIVSKHNCITFIILACLLCKTASKLVAL